MSFYHWAMRSAAAILFVISLLIVAGTVVADLLAWHAMSSGDQPFQRTLQGMQTAQFAASIVTSLGWASLPLFGAAALWRADLVFAARPEGRR